MADTPKPMQGTWSLTSPDGRIWYADSPIRCLREEQAERVPPHIAMQRIMEAADEPKPEGWLHRHGNHTEVSGRELSPDEVARGWTQEPLYTAAALGVGGIDGEVSGEQVLMPESKPK